MGLMKYGLHIFSALVLVLLLTVSFLLWREWSKRFPAVEPGRYVGLISGIFQPGREQRETETAFYLEHKAGSDKLNVVILRAGWTPEDIPAVPSTSDPENAKNYMPISVASKEARLKLTGAQSGTSEYSGELEDLKSGASGSWKLHKVNLETAEMNTQTRENLKLWLLLRSELAEIDSKIEVAQTEVPRQRDLISQISASITDGDRLRAKAEEKLGKFREELKEQQAEILSKRTQLSKLEQSFEISLRVFGMGKLVSLARESLEREGRWFESMLKVSLPNEPEGLPEALQKAERIVELKRFISIEKERNNPTPRRTEPVRTHSTAAATPAPTTQTEKEKDTWGGWKLW